MMIIAVLIGIWIVGASCFTLGSAWGAAVTRNRLEDEYAELYLTSRPAPTPEVWDAA